MAARIPLIEAIYMEDMCALQVADRIVFCEFVETNYAEPFVRSMCDM